jgi:hypothetical protein
MRDGNSAGTGAGQEKMPRGTPVSITTDDARVEVGSTSIEEQATDAVPLTFSRSVFANQS